MMSMLLSSMPVHAYLKGEDVLRGRLAIKYLPCLLFQLIHCCLSGATGCLQQGRQVVTTQQFSSQFLKPAVRDVTPAPRIKQSLKHQGLGRIRSTQQKGLLFIYNHTLRPNMIV